MSFKRFLGAQLTMGLLTGLVLGLLLAIAVLLSGGLSAELGVEFELAWFDGFWLLLILPLLLALLVLVASPFSYALLKVIQRWRRGNDSLN
jgi:hypothetical protein